VKISFNQLRLRGLERTAALFKFGKRNCLVGLNHLLSKITTGSDRGTFREYFAQLFEFFLVGNYEDGPLSRLRIYEPARSQRRIDRNHQSRRKLAPGIGSSIHSGFREKNPRDPLPPHRAIQPGGNAPRARSISSAESAPSAAPCL